ncbi:hypothetical protein V8G54_018436 [Vigna mungo]|uniref:Uncharacterized protein n=1 Tax=Vigna mungo TaxID=3915 RepID=A0AAQ3N8T0_VIGMU
MTAAKHVLTIFVTPTSVHHHSIITTFLKLQNKIQHSNDVVHGRPLGPILQQTGHGHLSKFLQTLGCYLALQCWIHNFTQTPLLISMFCPINKRHLLLLHHTEQRLPPTQYLQQHNPKRVHVRLLRQPLSFIILRV